jgi:hypothetical protein
VLGLRGHKRNLIGRRTLNAGAVVGGDNAVIDGSADQIGRLGCCAIAGIGGLRVDAAGCPRVQSVAGGIGPRIAGREIRIPS